jgi:rhamnose transport system ATP-binding protein
MTEGCRVPPSLLEASSIRKSFAAVRALKGVSFDVRAGEVHALVGENGAGKSTLIRVMTGAETADSGTVAVSGHALTHLDPATAKAAGIAAIYQQPALFSHLTVAENVTQSLQLGGAWRAIDWPARRRHAARQLERVGAALDLDALVETLTLPEQQLVEIAKALGADARILIMDEPTAALSDREVRRLFQVVVNLREQGVGIVYISHRLEEVFEVADRITVLRDGETVTTRATGELNRSELIRLMVGREIETVFPRRPTSIGDLALELRHLTCRATNVRDVSLSVRRGEILGLAGLVGSGRTQLAEAVFGLTPVDSGEIVVHGQSRRITSPADAIRAGIGYVPEDRRRHGVVLEMSIASNTSLASLRAMSRWGLIDRQVERKTAERSADRFRIKPSDVSAPVATLSGGNQQKVAVARWLTAEPSVLILDEPTQGVDVGSKAEIHALMQELTEGGLAIIMISSDLPEVLGMSDRIVVMRQGTIRGELSRKDATPTRVLALALDEGPVGRN